MRVIYDSSNLIAGIGVTPWTRLGPDRWFHNYKIVACQDVGVAAIPHIPSIFMLGLGRSGVRSTRRMVHTDNFCVLANGPLADYRFMPYRPVEVSNDSLQHRFIMNNPAYSFTYENKAWIRETFGSQLPFAPFEIYPRSSLYPTQDCFDRIRQGWDSVVLQNEQIGGGRGTYIVSSLPQFKDALEALPNEGRIIVSKLIRNANERSVQCCITRYGTFASSLQKQFIRNRWLQNPALPVTNGFCGGEVGTVSVGAAQRHEIDRCIRVIGDHMATAGYKGIFGIDFLLHENAVYVLEVNARMTGMTPLHNMLYQKNTDHIPLGLLHILELADIPYTLDHQDSNASPPLKGSMLILRNQSLRPVTITAMPAAGIYTLTGDNLELVRPDAYWNITDARPSILLQPQVEVGSLAEPGAHLITVMTRTAVSSADDTLNDYGRAIVSAIYAAIKY